jgi:ribose transport system substrate-binding protein
VHFWTHKSPRAVMAVALIAVTVAAWATQQGSNAAYASNTPASKGSTHSGGAASAQQGVAAARQTIAAYVGHPGPFPVTDKLKRVPKGALIAYVGNTTQVSVLTYQYVSAAAKVMGVRVKQISAGDSATSAAQAFTAVVATHPKAVIVVGVNMDLWSRYVPQLKSQGAKIVAYGVTGTAKYGIHATQAAEGFARTAGKLLAAYAVAKWGSQAHIVYYPTPELAFTKTEEAGVRSELAAVCPGCSLRVVDIPITALGTTAPGLVVADLQAHPDTTAVLFPIDLAQVGLPAALKVAGINMPHRIGVGPVPANLEYLKTGQEAVALGYDQPVQAWELLDQAAREIVGQKLTGPASQGVPVMQFLTQKDITFNPKNGWTGYPNYAKRFAQLWAVKP